jgi:hypothetical protein
MGESGSDVWILVVEDEKSMLEVLCQGLEEENHTVTLGCLEWTESNWC